MIIKDRQSGTPINQPTNVAINAITDDYVLKGSDNGEILKVNSADPVTITLPNDMEEGFACMVAQKGAGAVTFAAEGTLEATGTMLETQYTAATVVHEGNNVWAVYGNLS